MGFANVTPFICLPSFWTAFTETGEATIQLRGKLSISVLTMRT